jgi:hypothetical protein
MRLQSLSTVVHTLDWDIIIIIVVVITLWETICAPPFLECQ